MATTGTTDFELPLYELVEEAFERASGGARELRSGYDFRTARRSLNLLTIEWASRGLNLWAIEEGSVNLVAGTSQYNLPADTVDLIEHHLRINDGLSTQSDQALNRISVSTYASIDNKTATGRPVQIFIERRVSQPRVNLWPVPDAATTYKLVYWRLRRMEDAGDGANTQDIPFRFLPCMVAGLAYYIAMKIPEGSARLEMLKASYEEQWSIASSEDRDRASVRFVPLIGRV